MKLDAQLLAAEYLQGERARTTRPAMRRQQRPPAGQPDRPSHAPPWAVALSAQLGAVQTELAGLRAQLLRLAEQEQEPY